MYITINQHKIPENPMNVIHSPITYPLFSSKYLVIIVKGIITNIPNPIPSPKGNIMKNTQNIFVKLEMIKHIKVKIDAINMTFLEPNF